MSSGTSNQLTWVGKGGGTVNTILWTDDLVFGPPTNVLHSAAFGDKTLETIRQALAEFAKSHAA